MKRHYSMGTHFQGTLDQVRALNVYIKLVRAADAVTARVNAHLADHNLTISQFGVLEAIYHLGELCQKDLAEKILKSSGNLTFVIDNLVKRGLVQRRRNDIDRRRYDISLTEAGHHLIDSILEQHVQGITDDIQILTVVEQEELARLCRKIGLQQS